MENRASSSLGQTPSVFHYFFGAQPFVRPHPHRLPQSPPACIDLMFAFLFFGGGHLEVKGPNSVPRWCPAYIRSVDWPVLLLENCHPAVSHIFRLILRLKATYALG